VAWGSSGCSWCLGSQQQLGTSDEVRGLQSHNPDEANALSVRLELQAGGYSAARERALTRVEGRDYVMQDGDVVTFRFTPS
jgi:predicted metalloprotease